MTSTLPRAKSVATVTALALAAYSTAQAANLLVNPTFEAPPGTASVDSTVAGWTLVEGAQRATFHNHTPGGTHGIWFKTFQPIGGGVQQQVGITGGANYLLSGFNFFEASYPNTAATTVYQVTWLDAGNSQVGDLSRLEIQPSSVTQTNAWLPYSLNVTAPAAATQALVFFGWEGGGTVTGAQSAFIDDVVFDGPGTPPPPITSDWVPNSAGDWNVSTNWANGTTPNAVGATANFLGAITAAHTVYTDTPVVVGSMNFNNANTYVIAGAGTLTMDVASGSAAIGVQAGSHKINLPLRLNDNTVATVASGATLTIADPLTLANGSTLTKAGAGTLEIISTVSSVSGSSSLIVSAGSANLRTDVGAGTSLQTTGGTTTAYATQHVGNLSVGSGSTFAIDSAGAAKVVKATGLTLGGKLDIGDNGLVVSGDLSAAVRAAIIAGYNGGTFNGTSGITSSAGGSGRGIGYATSTQIGNPANFLGEALSGTNTLVRYTLLGDFDLSGAVDFTDLLALAKNYNGTNRAWFQGDSDYSGVVDFTDLLALAKNYNKTLPGLAELGATSASFDADYALAQSLVPEPAGLSLIGLGASALLRRRRRD